MTLTATGMAPCTGTASDGVLITIQATPTAAAGDDQKICAGSTVTLAGSSSNGASVQWTTSGTGSFDDATTLNAIYTPSAADITAGTVTLTLTATGMAPCTGTASDGVLITIQATPTAAAGDDQKICAGSTVTLAGSSSNGASVQWTTSGTGSFDDATTLNAIYTPSAADITAGTVTLTLTATGMAPCTGTASDGVLITIQATPTAAAGDDQKICAGSTVTLAGSSSNGASVQWTTSGTGSFDDATTLNAIYTPSAADITAGTVTLTLKATGMAPCTGTASDDVLITFSQVGCTLDVPEWVCSDSTNNTASVDDAGAGATYVWTVTGGTIADGDGTKSIYWTAGASGSAEDLAKISVTVTNSNGCSASCDKDVSIRDCALPTLAITCPADKEVCNDQGKTYATILLADLGTPTVDDPTAVVTNNASANNQYPIGTTNVTWTATDAAGNTANCDQKVTVKSCCGGCTLNVPEWVCSDSTGNTASVADAGAGATYVWTVTGGTITSTQPYTNEITWTAGAAGSAEESAKISVTVTNSNGCSASCDKEVSIRDCAIIGGGLKLKKTALNATVTRDQGIYFTIDVWNDGPDPLHNVTLWDALPDSVDLVYISPEPVSNYVWHIDTLEVGQHFVVDLVVIVKKTNLNYDMSQGVKGVGFANVHNDYDTSLGPKSVMNCAYASADFTPTISDCASTGIYDPGTELKRRQFGSGTYASEELTKIRTENKSIKTTTSLFAVYKPTTFSLPKGRSLNYGTKWTDKSKARNEVTNATMNEEYTFANKITKDSSVELDKNGSTMKTDVEFEGVGHIGVLKDQPNSATVSARNANVKPVMESQEDYVGNFKTSEYVDEYGTSVVSNKSTTGFGYVAVDKRIANSQRTYESGTGSYQSEELIDTPTSYLAKNISLVHAPVSYSYSPNFQTNQNIKWSEGMWSKSGGLPGGVLIGSCNINDTGAGSSTPSSLISEKYSYLDSLKKETVASGLNEMKTQASFSGQADYRVLSHGTNNSNSIDSEERYVGKYDINRHVLLTGVSKYGIPHLTVIKEGQTRNEWYNGTLATLADYAITITNDGNTALAPIQVRDFLPPGTQYIRSTIRPVKLDTSEAEWTLPNLGIGNTITIGLTLNITEDAQGNIINRVEACGEEGNGSSVCAGNYSSIEFGYLTCCQPKILLSKNAKLDADDPTVVHYSIVVANKAADSVAVTVTDQLTGGMTLLGASISPNIDSAGQMIWALPEIRPGQSKTIEYTTKASRDGGFTSTAHIDATAINGAGVDTADASAYIAVTGTGNAPRTFRYDGWEPPNWNLTSSESDTFIGDIIDSFTLEVEDSGSPDTADDTSSKSLQPGTSTATEA